MDLRRLENVKAEWEKLSAEEKADMVPKVANVTKWMNAKLPALSELDKAAVADYIAQLLNTIGEFSVAEASDLIYSTVIAYGLGAVEYLGWINLGPEVPGA